MEALKQLIVGTIAIAVMGVAYDAAAEAGVINGDGGDHTVSYFAAPAMTSQSAASTMTIVNNAITGDECRVPPTDRPQRGTVQTIADATLLAAIEAVPVD